MNLNPQLWKDIEASFAEHPRWFHVYRELEKNPVFQELIITEHAKGLAKTETTEAIRTALLALSATKTPTGVAYSFRAVYESLMRMGNAVPWTKRHEWLQKLKEKGK